MTDRVDVAVVGGGAAGIAAARRLTDIGRSVLLIEASPRLGGRARSVMVQGMPLDFGCGWLHSAERNPLANLADAQGQVIDRRKAAYRTQLRDIHFSAEDQRDARASYDRFVDLLHSDPPPSDRAADAYPPNDRWRPFVDGISSLINGTELDTLSASDFDAYDDAASDNNWRLPGGLGAFIVGLANHLPSALETTVTSVTHADDIALETNRGTIHATAAIVAVSTAMLAKGAIRFTPAVTDHLHAASRLPLGLANKIFLSIADPKTVPEESHLRGRVDRAATGSYYLRPFGRPVIESFVGGTLARALEDADDVAAAAFAIDQLRALLGADFARGLTPLAVTRWAQDPLIGGSYSHALPGHADARAMLARPVSERLCFAGEACSATDFSTAHGAWQSGVAAADWIARSLR